MIRTPQLAVTLLFVVFLPALASAHSNLSAYVQHDLTLEAGASYIDLTLQLTFFDELAASRRAAIDRNGDGAISSAERGAFQKALLDAVEKHVALESGGKALELVPRFDPEITYVATTSDGAAHLRFEVRVHLFARRPDGLRAGAELEVRDGLYAEYPAMAAFYVGSADGERLAVRAGGQALTRPAGAEGPLVFRAQLAGSAVAQPEKQTQSSSNTIGARP